MSSPVYDLRSPEVNEVFDLLITHGPATAWKALQATGDVASFPVSVVNLVRRRLDAHQGPLRTSILSQPTWSQGHAEQGNALPFRSFPT
jgi:hypothetical protein